MNNQLKPLGLFFFATEKENEPVREWLKTLSKTDKKIIGEDIKTVQYGWPLGMPLVRSLDQGLWEVRTKLRGSREARVIFFMAEDTMVLANGFIKKTPKTPKAELDLAKSRKKVFESRK